MTHIDRTGSGRSAAAGAASPIPGFVTCDRRTFDMLRRARDFARSHLPVLVEGPSGTGKELLAAGIHAASRRAAGPWIPVNCGALPDGLQESELFGVRRGAFTGAAADRVGLIEAADGGTLFLDEVGEMAASTQAKLLRFLEEGEIRRLGDTEVRRVDVRVVAATHRNLLDRARRGRFRTDLYYRLCGAPLDVPGLDERPPDIPVLLTYFLDRFRRRYGARVHLPPAVAAAARTIGWPGNVRQLRNELERAAVIAEAEGRPISIDDFPRSAPAARDGGTLSARLAAFERDLIREALDRCGWNKAEAARYLGGVKRTTLIGRMQRLGISEPAEGMAQGR